MKPFEAMYPTRKARDLADKHVDNLSIHLPLSEHIRQWELVYLNANGIVKK